MEMSERIKERRIELGYTQEQLADMVGLQKSAIAKYENGRVENIKKSMIQNLAKALKCRPSYLMGFDDINDALFERVLKYYNSLNELGRKDLEKHMEDTHPKFFKKDETQ